MKSAKNDFLAVLYLVLGVIFFVYLWMAYSAKNFGTAFGIGTAFSILGITGIIITIPSLTKGIFLEIKSKRYRSFFMLMTLVGLALSFLGYFA
ncbi:MAG: hypothetical protein AAB767_04815 [Patescibacteria group bacterium]